MTFVVCVQIISWHRALHLQMSIKNHMRNLMCSISGGSNPVSCTRWTQSIFCISNSGIIHFVFVVLSQSIVPQQVCGVSLCLCQPGPFMFCSFPMEKTQKSCNLNPGFRINRTPFSPYMRVPLEQVSCNAEPDEVVAHCKIPCKRQHGL